MLAKCTCLVLAPGVPLTHPEPHPVVNAAKAAGVEILSDIELLHRLGHERRVIGITGTNGKSTTTALITHVLTECGKRPSVGGNIGEAVFNIKMPPKDSPFVLELSSFQIDLCPGFAPDTGILLNITPDHIDRHGSVENYAAIKERIFAKPGGAAIIGVDDDFGRKIYERLKSIDNKKLIPVSVEREAPGGVYVQGGVLFDDTAGTGAVEIGSLNNIITLHGLHNMQNAACAYAAARLEGLEAADIMAAIKTYPGLPHRQFPVRIIKGVAYINDSKATNAEASAKALMSYRNIYWIVGGKPKDGGLEGLERYAERIRHAFLIGKYTDILAKWLDNHGIPYTLSETMDMAVKESHHMAQGERGQPGGAGVVLLSPACASYDQFNNFEERGDLFVSLVQDLSEEEASA
ncbi:MAG: UDP-N-acetylmuramoyl-L-alanine--D-glutamate ligase [Alphaproteobacteria bacterium]|nr:UDP-N-acetylmuramoyl-L-alanine--D-glutamate ligase [Alphaproteobacteria bacterium]